MDYATVALPAAVFLSAFSCTICTEAVDAAAAFRYPDDDHVIITQYGPMRYEPVSADQDIVHNPGGGAKTPPSRGYFKAEVIPLDMKTWKPLQPGGDGYGTWVDRRAVGPPGARAVSGPGRAGAKPAAGPGRTGASAAAAATRPEFETIDVPLRVGFSVQRPAKPVVRRRRHDYFLTSPHGYLHRYPGGGGGARLHSHQQPAVAAAAQQDLWSRP